MAKKRKLRPDRIFILLGICIVLTALIIGLLIWLFTYTGDVRDSSCYYDLETYNTLDIDLNSANYLITKVDSDGLRTLYAYGEDEQIYPASLTKVMTMMVTLDYTYDIDTELTVTTEDLAGLIEANASVAGLSVGDTITIKEALYGLILESGADCANLLKRYVEEQGYDFIELMNEKASDLGMSSTHFANVTGLHDDDNYTTLSDLAKLFRYAINNDNAYAVLTTMYFEEGGYYFESTLSSLADDGTDNFTILGGKTGFIYESHLNIFAVVENEEGEIYFIIMAGADEQGEDGYQSHYRDVMDIMATYFARW